MAKRMFVSLDLPQSLAAALAGLDPQLAGLRWLAASQLHLTLCFLGTVAEQHEQRLVAALAAIRVPRFPLALHGLGCFAHNRQPAVVWVGVETTPPELSRLQLQVRAAVRAAGLTAGTKPFHPHITVGRCKNLTTEALQPLLTSHLKTTFGTFEVTGFTLFASILHPHGPEHVPVFRHSMQPD